MKAHVRYGLLLVAGLCATAVSAQEICNNALDDDADGLIDLNDTADCVCNGFSAGTVPSLIPNPSFEVYDCVPDSLSELACAEAWQQATDATTDYLLNVPGALWDVDIPQPLPDGIGIAGGVINPAYREYLGACLTAPMEAGVEYTLRMRVAAGAAQGDSIDGWDYVDIPPVGAVDITLFGSASCPGWPVIPVFNGDCVVGVDDWAELGAMTYVADGTWLTVTITFVPATDILAVMIGAPCGTAVPGSFSLTPDNPYYAYFLYDDLTLNETALFDPLIGQSGRLCTNDLVLHVEPGSTATGFQWYLNGVALPGQTDSTLQVSANGLPAGTYQLLASVNDTACTVSELTLFAPQPPTVGVLAAPLSGCAPLAVQFAEAAADSVASCTWAFGDGDSANVFEPLHVYEDPGTYDVTLAVTLADGCRYDTTYQDLVVVSETPVAAFTANPQPATPDDTEISFTDQSSGGVTAWIWDFDSIPPFTSTDSDPTVTFPAIPGEYPVVLVVTNAAGCTDTLRSSIRVESNGEITLPNVFTPNGDGVNDRFLPLEDYPGQGRLTVLNRWGQEVFTTASVTSGWSGADAPDGTYFWTLEALEDRGNPLRSGYVTLLRGR
jgi:gliding motility-associated-like protein